MSSINAWIGSNIGPVVGGLLLLALASIVLLIWLFLRLRRAERRYLALTAGTGGGGLHAVLEEHVAAVREATARMRETDELARRLERLSAGYTQRVGFVRFNPFRDAGGDQSFALVLADRDGNGVVISSLHSREATRVYGKPLAAWESPYALTDEEKQAIQRAQTGW